MQETTGMHMMCYSACTEVSVIFIVAEIGIVSVIVRCIERPCDNYMFVFVPISPLTKKNFLCEVVLNM